MRRRVERPAPPVDAQCIDCENFGTKRGTEFRGCDSPGEHLKSRWLAEFDARLYVGVRLKDERG